ncbi:glycoside hydrolase family 26 protein [Planotetraspora sp. GP83]|uniref:glycoside hydrolase family 26 protein n=1 Tax=Planotetraspora sp. GP83 TaxID=3156264 RepID=UPI0035124EA5
MAVLAPGCLAGCGSATGTSRGLATPLGHGRRPPGDCAVTEKLIPTCGVWWGIAPDVFSGRRPLRAVEMAERRMGRRADIVHVYHRNGELFPTPEEREIAKGPRLLLVNWKPAMDHTWAEVAHGAIDHRIDTLADYITRTFPGRFFLTIHHEPENDVRQGAGNSAADYAAMYRHIVTRLRERGVRNAVTVMTYMGAPNWADKPWFEKLYPGDDVVDWVGLDPYADDRVSDFAGLVNKTRPDHPQWPGFYRWMQSRFPAKPIMIAEWGAFERSGMPRFKRDFYTSVGRQIDEYPQIKALVYFDSPLAPRGDTRFDTTPGATRAFIQLGRERRFTRTAVPAQ